MKSSQTQEQLIVFTRYPEPGKTKTRLAHTLGEQGAADLHRNLAERTLSMVLQLQQMRAVEVKVYFEGGDLQLMEKWLGPGFIYQPQENGDLGERLVGACSDAFKQGHKRVVVIGSDCPDLTTTHIEQAFKALYHKDLVLGPATDGGYYLIGMNRENKSLFTQIPWSTEAVMASTLKAGEKLALAIETLETLSDVDRPEDLKHINHNSDS
jgi:rSAM/selenodomain-associated transferase 1